MKQIFVIGILSFCLNVDNVFDFFLYLTASAWKRQALYKPSSQGLVIHRDPFIVTWYFITTCYFFLKTKWDKMLVLYYDYVVSFADLNMICQQ